jgi:hypothetical protein
MRTRSPASTCSTNVEAARADALWGAEEYTELRRLADAGRDDALPFPCLGDPAQVAALAAALA